MKDSKKVSDASGACFNLPRTDNAFLAEPSFFEQELMSFILEVIHNFGLGEEAICHAIELTKFSNVVYQCTI